MNASDHIAAVPNVQVISDKTGSRMELIGWPEFEEWARANLSVFAGVEMMSARFGLSQEDGHRFVIAFQAQLIVGMLERLKDVEIKQPIILNP